MPAKSPIESKIPVMVEFEIKGKSYQFFNLANLKRTFKGISGFTVTTGEARSTSSGTTLQ